MVEGEAAVVLELSVHGEDVERVRGNDGQTLRSVRNIISAAAGKKKATVDLITQEATVGTAAEE